MDQPISSEDLIIYINEYMETAKKGYLGGWSMTDILEDVYKRWGQGAWDFAYKYIVEDYCNLERNDGDV